MCTVNNKNNLRVLVTGAAGFLGGDIATYLYGKGYEIIGIDRTESTQNSFILRQVSLPSKDFDKVLEGCSPHALIHAAGTASVAYSMEYPYQDFKASVDIYAYVLDSVRRHLPQCKVIFLSSAAVYGNPGKLPIKESDNLIPISAYGYHKLIAEKLSQAYHNLYGIKTCNLRIFSAYGEHLKKQVIYEMASKFFSGSEVNLYGTGEESRDFIYALDVARAVEKIILNGDFSNSTYNLASGVETSIAELAEQMRKLINQDAVIDFDGKRRSGDPCRWKGDVGKLKELGFYPKWPLNTGLKSVVDYWNSKK